MKVLKSRSVDGLDPTLFEMDTICNTVTAFYHIIHKYPINTSVELYCWQCCLHHFSVQLGYG